jgi:hypothetical protein
MQIESAPAPATMRVQLFATFAQPGKRIIAGCCRPSRFVVVAGVEPPPKGAHHDETESGRVSRCLRYAMVPSLRRLLWQAT